MSLFLRHSSNPVFVSTTSIGDFVPSVCKWRGNFYLVYREDDFSRGAGVALISSADGIHWNSKAAKLIVPANFMEPIVGNPRIFIFDDRLCVTYKQNDNSTHVETGILTYVISTQDLLRWDTVEKLDICFNVYQFPNVVNGRSVYLGQIMPAARNANNDKFDIWFLDPSGESSSTIQGVLAKRNIAYADLALSITAQPIYTPRGWLIIFRACTSWQSRCCQNKQGMTVAGACLLDVDRPWIVRGVSKEPVIWPELKYETDGEMPTIYPCGVVLDTDRELRLYYTPPANVLCLATASVDALVDACC